MNITPTQLTLVRLLGKKELSKGCIMENEYAGDSNPRRFFVFDKKSRGCVDGFSCVDGRKVSIIDDAITKTNLIGHIPTVAYLHMWMNENHIDWAQSKSAITAWIEKRVPGTDIKYDSSKDLIDQSDSTLQAIITLIQSNER